MLDVLLSTRINSDVSDEDIKPGEYRDALNVSLIANEVGAFSKGTTYGNTDTNIVFKGLNPDAICLGTAVDVAGVRGIVTFYQRITRPFEPEYQGILDYAVSRGMQVPSAGVQAAQNYLITLLKRDGIWSGLDVFFCFFGDGDEAFAKINWKIPNDATLATNSGLTYNANYGFKANGAQFLNTNWIPSAAVKYTLNNASYVIGMEQIFVSSGGWDGVEESVKTGEISPQNTATQIVFSLNSTAGGIANDAQLSASPGLTFVSRSSSTATAVKRNTSASFSASNTAVGRPDTPFYLGGLNDHGAPTHFTTNRYSLFAAGENLATFDRENKFYTNWLAYKNSFVTPLVEETQTQQVLMYLITDPIGGVVSPLVKSIYMRVTERSYLDGYSFVNELFYFNFRQSAPKMINIQRALDSPGFYDNLSETLLTVIKPHPPYAPVPLRVIIGSTPNPPIQKKPFQFMFIYRFSDGETSTKSPASEYLNSLDDLDTLTSMYDSISVTMDFPLKDYPLVKEVELFVRNNNGGIVDWRSAGVYKRDLFVQAGEVYRYPAIFTDTAVGNFLPEEQATKINEAIPQRSNYLAFIENRLFMIDSLLDYNFTPTYQILLTLDSNTATPDDRLPSPASDPRYAASEFEYDSNYMVGLVFYDAYGRKYPASISNKVLTTPRFVPAATPATTDFLPTQVSLPQLRKAKITAKYDLRAAGNIANYGKPPSWAYWWGMIRSKNIKWEFQKSIQALLRFPYSNFKWPDTDPAKFPVPNYMFLEDGYLYWDAKALMYGTTGAASHAATTNMVNDYIDIVIPSNFPFALDKNVLIDFMIDVTGSTSSTRHQILDREVVDIFANKIRIRGNRDVRWFQSALAQVGQFRNYPKFTTGVNLTGTGPDGIVLLNDEITMPIIIKRLRLNTLESTLLYDTPQVYPVTRPGTIFATFQATQTSTIQRVEYPPSYTTPVLARTLNQGDILIQPINLTPTTVAFNHRIKILWGPNTGDSLRLRIKVSLWQLNDLKQPILELYSSTSGVGGAHYVKNSELVEYLITPLAEVIGGWYGYGVQILEATASSVNFENPEFDTLLSGWLQSPEGSSALTWLWGSFAGNFAYAPVPAMGVGYSKTLYQYLFGVPGADLSVEVKLEAVNVLGPVSTGAIVQYPGNTGNPLTANTVQQLFDLGRVVIPYYVDCALPAIRRVSMNTLEYTLFNDAPFGTQVRAELWILNQTTRQPVSMMAGSEGSFTPIGAVGLHSINLGANKIIDTTGWYGVAIYVDLPTFGNFLNSNYASGAASWILTGGSSSVWVFQADTAVAPVYAGLFFAPPLGTWIEGKGIETNAGSITPAFWLPPSVDPAGYDQIYVWVHWGDNNANGWNGQLLYAGLWEVNQTTKQPLPAAPLYSSVGLIEHNLGNYLNITSLKLPGNKWYAVGLYGQYGHPDPTQRQFSNFSFNFLTSWTVTAGSSGTWTGGSSSAFISISGSTTVDTGKISQALAGYLEAVLEIETQDTFTSLFANMFVGGTLIHSIQMVGAGNGSGTIADPYVVTFPCVFANGAQVAFSITGVRTSGSFISLNYVRNAFDPYMGASPTVQYYTVSNANNESWRAEGTLGVQDYEWKYGYKYWKRSNHNSTGTANMSAKITVNDLTAGKLIIQLRGDFANDITPLVYGMINMVGGAAATYNVDLILRNPGSASQPVDFEIWAFNDPNTFTTTGTRVYLNTIVGGPSGVTITTTVSITIAAGIKYVGYRARWGVVTPSILYVEKVKWNAPAGYNSWDKLGFSIDYRAYVRENTVLATTIIANFHCDNIPPGVTSQRIGQSSITGITVQANIEIFTGLVGGNNYTLYLSDSAGYIFGSVAITGQAVSTVSVPVNPVITINAGIPPTTTGLYLAFRSDNTSGTMISVRIRNITNVNAPVNVTADSTVLVGKTWSIDSVGTMTQLTSTTFGRVVGTSDTPLVALPMEAILADAAGTAISAPQTFQPNDGIKTLVFAPTLAVVGNYNYGIKIKNNAGNLTTSGTVRIHSVNNIATNTGIAHIIANTINPAQPLYEAWNQFSLGSFVRSGYVSNFIAVVDDLIVSTFTPIQVNPTSYHLVHNVVPAAGIAGHSTGYGESPYTKYDYGVVYPSISSDPDALGIVFEQKTGCSIGDVSLVDIDLREKSHSNIVRWSDPVIAGTQTNNLNAFLDSNKYPVDFQRGSIEVMIAMHDHTIFCVHTQGMSSLYVQRSTMISPAEVQGQDDQLFLTSKVVGNDNKLTSNLGTVNPESCRVVESGTIAYGFDLVRKSFWQKTNNGVRNLTYECHAKKKFNEICLYRLKAYLDGEDIKIYSGYNEKQKSFYLTFAPFIYKGQAYPGVTIAYNAYIDGFLSRYSFEPMSYLSTEDVLHSIKARELTNPDFFGDFFFWQTNDDNGGTTDWYRSLLPSPGVKSDTLVPGGTRILNPDFIQAATFWSTYGAGSAWTFVDDGVTTTIPAGGSSKDLVNSSGAIANYLIRIKSQLPVTGLTYSIKIYNPAGTAIQTSVPATALTGDVIASVGQSNAGRVGVIFTNTTGASMVLKVNLFTTVVKTFLLYQEMPILVEDLRIQIHIPQRTGSIKVVIESFTDPLTRTILQAIDLVRNKDAYTSAVTVHSTSTGKYISLYAITDYDLTEISYFNANSVPSIWEHDRAGRTNNFFGVQYDTMIDMVFNVQAGQVRIFNSLGIMSEVAWSVELFETSENQRSALDKANFRVRDGIYSAAIMRDMLTPQESLPNPLTNVPILHGAKLMGTALRMVLRNSETLRQIELRAVYLGSDVLSGNLLARQ